MVDTIRMVFLTSYQAFCVLSSKGGIFVTSVFVCSSQLTVNSFATALAFLITSAFAAANDGWDVYVGSERTLRPHANIRMVKEYITMDLGDRCAWVTCTFWFRNGEPATQVQMAYPDESSSTYDSTPYSQLREFRSWVDGRRVPTRFRMLGQSGFQTKNVGFAAGQSHKVVNKYRMPLGLGASRGQVYVQELLYTFSTGASWKGKLDGASCWFDFTESFAPFD